MSGSKATPVGGDIPVGPGGANIPLNLRWKGAVCCWLRSEGSVVSLGTGSFVCGHAGKLHSVGTASKARLVAGLVGNYHFAGVKVIVFCPFFIVVRFSLKTCTGSVLVIDTGRRRKLCFFNLRASFQPCLAQGEVFTPQEPGRFLGVQEPPQQCQEQHGFSSFVLLYRNKSIHI